MKEYGHKHSICVPKLGVNKQTSVRGGRPPGLTSSKSECASCATIRHKEENKKCSRPFSINTDYEQQFCGRIEVYVYSFGIHVFRPCRSSPAPVQHRAKLLSPRPPPHLSSVCRQASGSAKLMRTQGTERKGTRQWCTGSSGLRRKLSPFPCVQASQRGMRG